MPATKGHRCIDAQQPARAATAATNVLVGQLQTLENLPDIRVVALSGVGQAHCAGMPKQQALAQVLFQVGDMTRYRRGRQTVETCGFGKAAGQCDANEEPERE